MISTLERSPDGWHAHWRYRLKRAAWFAAVGTLPRAVAQRIIARYPSDGPLSVLRG
jgi:hypothetical protein